MRILLVTNNYTPYSGGVVSALNALIAGLHEQKHEVMLITLDFMGPDHHDPAWIRRIPSMMRFRYLRNYMAVPWRAEHYIDLWMQDFQPEVVHVHHPFLLGPIAISCAKRRGIRTIFTYHTMYEKYAHYVPAPGAIVRSVIDSKLHSFCATVDHIIVPSRGIDQLVRDAGGVQSSVIPSGLQEQFLKEPFNDKKLGPPYQLLYVGRLVVEKNITFLLEVMASLPEQYQLTIVGYGSYADYLQEYAYAGLALSCDRVKFIIDPPKSDLLNYYRRSHIFLFASQTDTQGLVLAESMACSTPVIALDGMGQADCIEQGVNGYLVSNLEQMRSTIIEVCTDQERYTLLQQGAYGSRGRYDIRRLMEKIIAIYQG